MLVPLLLDSFGGDIYEGAGPTSGGGGGATAKGAGGVGMKAAVGGAAEKAKEEKAKLDAKLKTIAHAAKAAVDKAKASADAANAAADTAKAKSPEAKEEAEEASELAELFTVNNNQNDGLTYAYAYAVEPFFEGATSKKPVCKIFARLDKNKNNSSKLTKYIGTLNKWSSTNCK